MTSVRTQLPYEYYTLAFCPPEDEKLHYKSLNLGRINGCKHGIEAFFICRNFAKSS